ncbi:hypothetical protein MTO96_043724 [Rhipicephalus appendiculatus]
MVYLFLTIVVAAIASSVISRLSIPQVENDVASEVILGVKHDDGSKLPPIFFDRGGAIDAPEYTLAAFREAKNNSAFGVVFELSFTWDNFAVIFHGETLERTTNGRGRLSDIRFSTRDPNCTCGRWSPPPTPDIVYELRSQNPRIVTALTWRPGLLAYEDTNKTLRRFESRAATLMATIADWLYEKVLHVGLLPYVTGVSAVITSTNVLNAEYVRAWRSRGVHVIAWTSNRPAEKNFLRHVLRVPVITNTMRNE